MDNPRQKWRGFFFYAVYNIIPKFLAAKEVPVSLRQLALFEG